MNLTEVDILIIGAGPAGLAAAIAAREAGVDSLLVLEREKYPGGILRQCIHNGFGLHRFNEELTGPEYAQRDIETARNLGIQIQCNTMVLSVSPDREVAAISSEYGYQVFKAGAVILAMGCRERPRGALGIPGFRPAGVYTAGTAQRLVNIEGKCIGKRVVILGSGDIGLIMARRMTLEGAKVLCVAELMPYSGGLQRNITQCLDDFGIPLLLSHTVSRIYGKERVTGIDISEVDENRNVIPGTEVHYDCDTLLLSCGLLPENELTRQAGISIDRVTGGPDVRDDLETSAEGIFACGNVLHVHDLVDYVSQEASRAGQMASEFVSGRNRDHLSYLKVETSGGIHYSVPQYISPKEMEDSITVRFRVDKVYRDRKLCVYLGTNRLREQHKNIVKPGEMEQVVLLKKDLGSASGTDTIRICLED